jgi:NAD(P)-dependent dehydrogenase (short-subunit alcohol dehydrogenase family)
MAREGANIVVSGRELAAVEQSDTARRAQGVAAWGIPADVAHVGEAHRLAQSPLSAIPRLDILVNGTGTSIRGHFWEVSDGEWEEQVNVNFRSPFVLAQHAAQHMIAHGGGGRIVNISTIGAHAVHKGAAVYDSAKGAVEVMTKNFAYELAPRGISVNCMIPGAIADRSGATPRPEAWAVLLRNIPSGRLGRPRTSPPRCATSA